MPRSDLRSAARLPDQQVGSESWRDALRTPEGCPIPPNTLAELARGMGHYRFINDQFETTRLAQLQEQPQQRLNARVLQLQQVKGIGLETSDMLVNEVFWRNLRDQRAVSRYVGLTGSPDESGQRARKKKDSPEPATDMRGVA